jgi:hypothetical protein
MLSVRATFRVLPAVVLALAGASSLASAHYLWVAIDGKAGEKGTANIYFEEAPSPGDGKYLDPIQQTNRTWVRTVEVPKPQVLPTMETRGPKQRWLSARLAQAAPRSIDSYAKYGVYRHGKTDVLLHYYARNLDVQTHEDLHELARAAHLDLDMVPHDEGDEMDLTVLWKGKLAPGRTVYIRGPKGFQENLKTNDRGKVRFSIKTSGSYTFRTSVEEQTPGRDGEKDYSLIRHNATMVISLPLEK